MIEAAIAFVLLIALALAMVLIIAMIPEDRSH